MTDPLYKHIPFYITLVPLATNNNNKPAGDVDSNNNISYGLFYDISTDVTFDLGKEISAFHGHYRYMSAQDGDFRLLHDFRSYNSGGLFKIYKLDSG